MGREAGDKEEHDADANVAEDDAHLLAWNGEEHEKRVRYDMIAARQASLSLSLKIFH